MASMSAKRTQFSFPLRCSFPAVSSKSFIATMYGLVYGSHLSTNQGLYLALFHGANELNGLVEIIYNYSHYTTRLSTSRLYVPCSVSVKLRRSRYAEVITGVKIRRSRSQWHSYTRARKGLGPGNFGVPW